MKVIDIISHKDGRRSGPITVESVYQFVRDVRNEVDTEYPWDVTKEDFLLVILEGNDGQMSPSLVPLMRLETFARLMDEGSEEPSFFDAGNVRL